MLRSTASRLSSVLRNANQINVNACYATQAVNISKKHAVYDDEFDKRYENYFNNKDIDGWQIRQGINDLCGHDLVPDPKIVNAALKACRRVNDYALAVRIIEAVKDKCGAKVGEIYPYIVQEIRPTLDELGINTPEELGYDKPELALENVDEMH